MIKVCQKRRLDLVKKMGPNSLCLIESGRAKIRNNDVEYQFRPNSSFYYLTGYTASNSVLMIYKGKSTYEEIILVKKPNEFDEIWNGKLLSSSEISKKYKIKKCEYLCNLEKILQNYLAKSKSLYHSLEDSSQTFLLTKSIINKLQMNYRKGVDAPSQVFSLDTLINEMRLIKDAHEIKTMKYAARISAKAHINLMKKCKSGMSERDIEIELRHFFNINDAVEAYPSIVAAGENACVLHYIKNNKIMREGDLLLTDAACEYNFYASDITRTIPINGIYSKSQKEIYNIVLHAQKKSIEMCKPGTTLIKIHQEAVKWISKGLIKLDLVKGSLQKVLKEELYKAFYMHNTGHWLGLDVHDPLPYKIANKNVVLKPGMIFTVEPGIYIKPKKGIPKKYHNIGVRIEDNVLITRKGCEVITSDVPKTIPEIENLMSRLK